MIKQFVSLLFICLSVFREHGHTNVAYDLLLQETSPSCFLPVASPDKITENSAAVTITFKQEKHEKGNTSLQLCSGEYLFERTTSLAIIASPADTGKLVVLLRTLAANEKNPLLKRHFESVAVMAQDNTHPYSFTKNDMEAASGALNFFQHEGAKWETYVNGPRPLMMAFTSPTDHKNSYYWLFLPKGFDPAKKEYPLYVELHGSRGGSNDNPRQMLFQPLQPEVAGVTNQGYRKEGLFILPWGRGDKGYRDTAEKDISECLQDFDRHFTTDPKRQYLYGFSMGGGGTYHLSQKSADRWTAIGLYSASFGDTTYEGVANLKGMPVWMVWGENEGQLTEKNRALKDAFVKQGNEIWWREKKGVGHNYMGEYQELLMNWFIKHKKK